MKDSLFSSFIRIRGTSVQKKAARNIFHIYVFSRGFCGGVCATVAKLSEIVDFAENKKMRKLRWRESHFIKYLTFGNERKAHTHTFARSSHLICTALRFLQSLCHPPIPKSKHSGHNNVCLWVHSSCFRCFMLRAGSESSLPVSVRSLAQQRVFLRGLLAIKWVEVELFPGTGYLGP